MSDWEVVPAQGSDWQVVPEKPPEPGFGERLKTGLERIGSTFKGAGRAVVNEVKHSPVAAFINAPSGQGLSAAGQAFKHGLDFSDPQRRAEADQFVRGVDDLVTLGYGQKAGDALSRHFHGISPEEQAATEQQRQAAAPDYRSLGNVTGMAAPGAANLIGKAGGAGVKLLTGGLKATNPLMAAALGAGRSALGYELTAPVQAGLSAGAAGKRLGAAKEAATDPAGLLVAGGTGALAEGGRAGIRKLAESAPERILGGIKTGEEGLAGATKTAGKLLARDKADIVKVITEDPEVGAVYSAPAKKALPVLHAKLEQWGSQLDPLYDVVDKATGGVRLRDFVTYLDDQVLRLQRDPLNEKYVAAVEDIRDSALKAWSPDSLRILNSNPGVPRGRLLAYITDKVPSQALRKMTTRLQTRGSQVINPLNPGEASIMKADMADMVKGFLDQHLDEAAHSADPQVGQAVNMIRNEINPRYSALKNITKAVEQRGDNEATRSKSLRGLAVEGLGAGSAMHALATGHPGRAVAIYAGSKALPAIGAAVEPRVNIALAKMAQQPANTAPARTVNPLLQAAEAGRKRKRQAAAALTGGP